MRLATAGRVAAVLLGGALTGAPAWGAGGQRFGPGTVELALKGGYAINHPPSRATAADGVHVVPHVGFFLSGERGPGWTRGNVELLVEPTLIHFDVVDSTTIGGVAILARWVFSGWPAARPYVEGGAGVLGGQVSLRQTNCDTNFTLQAGAGVLVPLSQAVAVTLGYRVHHVSNADLCTENLGINSSLFLLGISRFFH